MTFAEFSAVCDGFERFHGAQAEAKPEAPSMEDLYRARARHMH